MSLKVNHKMEGLFQDDPLLYVPIEEFRDAMKKLTPDERRSYVRAHPNLDTHHLRAILLIKDDFECADAVLHLSMHYTEGGLHYAFRIPKELYYRRQIEIKNMVTALIEHSYEQDYDDESTYVELKFISEADDIFNCIPEADIMTMTDKMVDEIEKIVEDAKNPDYEFLSEIMCPYEDNRECLKFDNPSLLLSIVSKTFCPARHKPK